MPLGVGRRWLVLAVAASVIAPPARALAQNPDEIVERFLRALAHRKWDSAATYLDRATLLAGRDSILRRRDQAIPVRELTVQDLMRMDPQMPRVVAEYRLEEIRRRRAEAQLPLIHEFADIRSYEELASLSPTELAIEWLRGQDGRESYRRQLRQMGCSEDAQSLIAEMPVAIRVFGWVPAGDSLALVLFADPFLGGDDEESLSLGPLVAHLIKQNRVWRIRPRYDLLQAANRFSTPAECPIRADPP